MSERLPIKTAILKALLAADGEPMPTTALDGVGMTVYPAPPLTTVQSVVKELADNGYIAGSDDFTGRSWTLTKRGKHQAQQL